MKILHAQVIHFKDDIFILQLISSNAGKTFLFVQIESNINNLFVVNFNYISLSDQGLNEVSVLFVAFKIDHF